MSFNDKLPIIWKGQKLGGGGWFIGPTFGKCVGVHNRAWT